MLTRIICCASFLLLASLTPALAGTPEPAPTDTLAEVQELPLEDAELSAGLDLPSAFARLIPIGLGSVLGSVAGAALLAGGYSSFIALQTFSPILITSLLMLAPALGVGAGVLTALLAYELIFTPAPSVLALSMIPFSAGVGGVLGLYLGATAGLLSALLLESLFPRGGDCFCYADTYLMMGGAALGGMALSGFAFGSVASVWLSSVEQHPVE